ncbi:exodeoxyribonuclease VII large subunit [Thermopetrobacter sp. TC1]|uniref:exodeoxyribonuclease VII large subunit n=1 Tax=Thermopetrobacter sp. TC1 TaxID=1495045 RepID=UPI000B22101A|nr:exodeoxyribonuclease VII large subunit [Thermopetrobacter sp. TC1]
MADTPRIDPITGEILEDETPDASSANTRNERQSLLAEPPAESMMPAPAMMQAAAEPLPRVGNVVEYTVSDISNAIRRTMEDTFGHVRVRGEVGRVSRPSSGHVYLDLKDDKAVLACVMWRSTARRQSFQPEQGLEVVVTGRITTYPGQSKYQLIIETIEPAGIGALMALLEERKKKLAAEGLFDASRKKPLPFLPRIIGVVTSPTGAVIRDILHRLADRFPRRVLVWPVRVQGETCAEEVAQAIAGFNALSRNGPVPRPDLIIVARGGGSLEDLWGFNEEIVVRAAAASEIPLISAVGHETDWTLIDLAADWRAPTPTAAAEKAVPVRAELLAWVQEAGARLLRSVRHGIDHRRQRLLAAARALPRPEDILAMARQHLDHAGMRLHAALHARLQGLHVRLARTLSRLHPRLVQRRIAEARQILQKREHMLILALRRRTEKERLRLMHAAGAIKPHLLTTALSHRRERLQAVHQRLHQAARARLDAEKHQLAHVARLLVSLSHQSVLARGFALVRHGKDGHVLRHARDITEGMPLHLQFSDGTIPAIAGSGGKQRASSPSSSGAEASRPKRPSRRRGRGDDDAQGSLF